MPRSQLALDRAIRQSRLHRFKLLACQNRLVLPRINLTLLSDLANVKTVLQEIAERTGQKPS